MEEIILEKKLNHQIKIIALGGVGEIGKNLYTVEIDRNIYILDAGIMYPETEMLGIDFVIPDISYLIENKSRIQGIFLTHGHEDHIGALPYLLSELKVPVYGTKLTLELAKVSVNQLNKSLKPRYVEIDSHSRMRFDDITITFFNTNHSIPGSVGICINTKDGAIVYTGDFKFDQSANSLYQAEIGKIALIGERGVLCLLSESNGAERPGFTPSESGIVSNLSECFFRAEGRIFVACFASNISGLQHVFDAAKQNNKKVAVLGKTIETVYHIAMDLGFLDVAEDIIIPVNQVQKYPDNQVVILATGDKGEPFKFLQKMALQRHKLINIHKDDTILIAATPVNGRELMLTKTVDILSRLGAEVVFGTNKIHVSGHGSQEELKMMINLLRPKYLVPVHGDFKMMVAHEKIANSIGISLDHIALIENGDVLEITDHGLHFADKVTAGNVLVDGSGIGDVGSIVLRDRKTLSQDGILIVTVSINRASKKIVAGPEITSRGFIYVKESEEMIAQTKQLVRDIVEKKVSQDYFDWTDTKQEIRDSLSYFLYEKTKRRPLLMPVIMEVRNR